MNSVLLNPASAVGIASMLVLIAPARECIAQVAPNSAPSVSTPQSPTYPDDERLSVALGMLSKGAFDAAAVTATAVLAAKPECDRAAMILGIAHTKAKRYEEAKAFLVRARDSKQAFPERKHAAHFLGWCCFHLGEMPDAQAAFEAHLKLAPGEPDSTFGLGLVAASEDRLEDADRFYAAALEGFTKPVAKPHDQARVLVRMADLALRRDDVASAEKLLDSAVKAHAAQHETFAKLARVYDRQGRPAQADAARANEQRILEALGRREASKPAVPAGDAPKKPEGITPGEVEKEAPRAPAPSAPAPSPPAPNAPKDSR